MPSKKKLRNSAASSSRSQFGIVTIEDDSDEFTPIPHKAPPKSEVASVHNDQRNPSAAKPGNFIDLSDETLNFYDGDDDLRILRFQPTKTPFKKRRINSFWEIGQSSNYVDCDSPAFVCEICADDKHGYQSFPIENCTHVYCRECMVNYVDSKLQENVATIRCPVPNCSGLLEPEYCRPVLPKHMFDRWGSAMCDAVIQGSEKFYCPYKDCSALLIDDGEEVVRECKCPHCSRMFCAHCKVVWHAQMDCGQFQQLNADERGNEDVMLRNLAHSQNWKQCPKCRYYVEKSDGCSYMRCRCKHAFCYNCGVARPTHSAHCQKCRKALIILVMR